MRKIRQSETNVGIFRRVTQFIQEIATPRSASFRQISRLTSISPRLAFLPMDLAENREKAWVGDAVLALYAREWILRERGKMDGALQAQMTSNDFLATIGNPTGLEAEIGVIYETEGLQAAFTWISHEILPAFLAQERNRARKR